MKFNLDIENINYIKIIYQDKNGFSHCTKAAVKSIDERECYANSKLDEEIFVNTPQDIQLSIACDNGLYKTTTVLKRVDKDEHHMHFFLVTPQNIEYQQNREYFRVKLEGDAKIFYEGLDGENIEVPCQIYDISANGVRVTLEKNVTFPDELHLSLLFPTRAINVKAKYIRTDKEDKILKASFSFLDLNDKDLDYISRMCIQKQIEERRKNRL